MADIVENPEAPIVEKEVEENDDVPKVVEAEEKAVENGHENEIAAVATENGNENGTSETPAVPVVDEEEDESKDGVEEKNGDSTDAPTTEAVKRKVVSDSVDGVEETAETPEKKSKLSDENIATVEAEATA